MEKSIKVDEDIHKEVSAHCVENGKKIGKFYDKAALKLLEQERKSEKVVYDKFNKRV